MDVRAISELDILGLTLFFWLHELFGSMIFKTKLCPESQVEVLTFGFCESSAENRNTCMTQINQMGTVLGVCAFLQPHSHSHISASHRVQE